MSIREKLEAFNAKLHSRHYTYPAGYDEFKADLFQAYGVTGNPKSDIEHGALPDMNQAP